MLQTDSNTINKIRMNFHRLILFISLFLPAGNGLAVDRDGTLRYFLSRSSLVIVGTIVEKEIIMQFSAGIGPGPRLGLAQIPVHIRVNEVLFGSPPIKTLLLVELNRWDVEGPLLTVPLGLGQHSTGFKEITPVPLVGIKTGQDYIFFLVPHSKESQIAIGHEYAAWETADDWFGFMPVDAAMVYKLRNMRQNDGPDHSKPR